jgi:hypothetical protein
MKDWQLRWYSFCGDEFMGMYTEHEAYILFENKKMTSTQVEIIPPYGNWFLVWNRKLDKEFECWKG